MMDAYLSVGGIPEYLKYCQQASSVFLSLCQHAFLPDGFFSREYQRILVSSLASRKHYADIIEYLAKNRFASRGKIASYIKVSSNGVLSQLLQDLELCGFIEKYVPYHLKNTSNLARYRIADNYLRFYYKFIKPVEHEIQNGDYRDNPAQAINLESYNKWLGYAFEQFCCQQHQLVAKILGFNGIRYASGTFFNRTTEKDCPGYQFDLVFDRSDKVMTFCEVKYLQTPVTLSAFHEFEQKLERFPNRHKKTIQKVLITAGDVSSELAGRPCFDRIITLEDLLKACQTIQAP